MSNLCLQNLARASRSPDCIHDGTPLLTFDLIYHAGRVPVKNPGRFIQVEEECRIILQANEQSLAFARQLQAVVEKLVEDLEELVEPETIQVLELVPTWGQGQGREEGQC